MKPIVLLDIDDVLVDWRGAAAALGGPGVHELCDNWQNGFETKDSSHITHAQLWELIRSHSTFWVDIPKLPWADELIAYIEGLGLEWYFNTAASPHDIRSSSQKVEWVKSQGWDPQEKLAITKQKWLLAGPNKVLIDDRDSNAYEFVAAGGHAILLPQKWNAAHPFTDTRMHYVKECIQGCLTRIRCY